MYQKVKSFCYYDTAQLITIRDWRLGLLQRVLQLIILTYIIGWSLIINKSYQVVDEAIGSSDIKIKGTVWVANLTPRNVYDAADIVYPATERDATFITTAFLSTPGQTRGVCTWADDSNLCSRGCVEGQALSAGVQNGNCSHSNFDDDSTDTANTRAMRSSAQNASYCMLDAWCPCEDNTQPLSVLNGILNMTVFIRINVRFPVFDKTLDNTGSSNVTTLYENLWSISDIVDEAGLAADWESIKSRGAMLSLRANFDCDFDTGMDCTPTYNWQRLDNPASALSFGFNFRQTEYYEEGHRRDLIKRYGLRLNVLVSGRGGRFSIVPLLISVGAGAGLMGIASVLGDLVLMYFLGNRSRYYKANKFKTLDDVSEKDQQCSFPVEEEERSELGSPDNIMKDSLQRPFFSNNIPSY